MDNNNNKRATEYDKAYWHWIAYIDVEHAYGNHDTFSFPDHAAIHFGLPRGACEEYLNSV